MIRASFFVVALTLSGALWIATLLGAQAPAPTPSTPVSFSKDILPVMESSCLTCHGAAMQLGKLDLRTREVVGHEIFTHGPAGTPFEAALRAWFEGSLAGRSRFFRLLDAD